MTQMLIMTWAPVTVVPGVEAGTVLTRRGTVAISGLVVVDSPGWRRGCSQEEEQMEAGVEDVGAGMEMDVEDVCCCWPASGSES